MVRVKRWDEKENNFWLMDRWISCQGEIADAIGWCGWRHSIDKYRKTKKTTYTTFFLFLLQTWKWLWQPGRNVRKKRRELIKIKTYTTFLLRTSSGRKGESCFDSRMKSWSYHEERYSFFVMSMAQSLVPSPPHFPWHWFFACGASPSYFLSFQFFFLRMSKERNFEKLKLSNENIIDIFQG